MTILGAQSIDLWWVRCSRCQQRGQTVVRRVKAGQWQVPKVRCRAGQCAMRTTGVYGRQAPVAPRAGAPGPRAAFGSLRGCLLLAVKPMGHYR